MAYLSVYPGIASCCCDDIYIQLYHIAECACRTVFKFCYGKCSAYAVDGSEVCQHDGDQLCVPYKLRRTVLLFSGAMGRIPKELAESAQLDGANLRTELFRIVIPLCWPTISMIILLNIAGFFAVSGPVLLLTQGEAGTYTMAYYFFAQTKNNALYQPAAIGIMFTVILFPIVVLARWALGKVYADVEF